MSKTSNLENFLATQQDFLTPENLIPGATIIVAGIITVSAIALALGLTNKRYRKREPLKIIFKVDDSEPMKNKKANELPFYYVWFNIQYIIAFEYMYDIQENISTEISMPFEFSNLIYFIDYMYEHLLSKSELLDRYYGSIERISDMLHESSEDLVVSSDIQAIGFFESMINEAIPEYRRKLCLLRKAESIYLRYNPLYTRKPLLSGEEL